MRLASVIALAVVAVSLVTAASPADAQRRQYYRDGDQTERITIIDEQGRARTRITVRPRSYLDGGTQVIPGERKFTDYAYPTGYMNASPSASWDPTGTYRTPLPMPGYLPGYQPYLPY